MQLNDATYLEYEGLIKKRCNVISKRYGVEFDEVFGEAQIIFCESINKFDESKGIKFSTFLYHQLRDLSTRTHRIGSVTSKMNHSILHQQYQFTSDIAVSLDSSDCFYSAGVLDLDQDEFSSQVVFEDIVGGMDLTFASVDLLHDIESTLSNKASTYLKDLLTGSITETKDSKGGRPSKFPIEKLCNRYNWTPKEARFVKKEITSWWEQYTAA
jgi:hypothetical protein